MTDDEYRYNIATAIESYKDAIAVCESIIDKQTGLIIAFKVEIELLQRISEKL